MKILYALSSLGFVGIHESTLRHLCQNGHDVVLIYDDTWQSCPIEHYKHLLEGTARLTIERLVRRNDLWRPFIMPLREVRAYASYFARKGQAPYYLERWRTMLPKWLGMATRRCSLIDRIIASTPSKRLMRRIEAWMPPSEGTMRQIRKHNPDVVVASPGNLRYSEEIECIKAARCLGIPTAIMVHSWDNLTTKGLFHAMPDRMMIWNDAQRQEAIDIHGFSPSALRLVGAPFFDRWFDRSLPEMGRELFCKRRGLDSDRAFVLYLGSSRNIAPDESWLVEELARSFARHEDSRLRGVTLLVRPHGFNQDVCRKIQQPNVRLWFRDEPLPDTPDLAIEFKAAFRYAVCAVGVNTTGMMDAILNACPVVAMNMPQYRETNAFRAVHFQQLLKADIYDQAASVAEACDLIVNFCRGNTSVMAAHWPGFVRQFIRPRGADTCVGKIVAEEIEDVAETFSVPNLNNSRDVNNSG